MRHTVLTLLLLAGNAGHSQETTFPALAGETADGRNVSLPPAKAKGWTLVGIAYGKQAQPLLESWYEPAYLRFVAKHGLFAGTYEAEVYFVPLFVGVNKAAYEPSLKKFRKSASPDIVKHVVFSKADVEPFRTALGMTDKDVPYFFVIDDKGRVVHRTKGGFTDDKLDAIEEVLMR